jgi:thiol-disulfide isomerase/thioredoxin
MKYITTLTFIIFSFSILGCKSQEKEKETYNKEIVLVFKNLSKDINEITNQTGQSLNIKRPKFMYAFDTKYNILNVDSAGIYSTENEGKPIIFNYKFNVLDELNFIFFPGDSIEINDKYKFPIIRVLNRETKKYDYSFDSFFIASMIDKKGFTPINRFYNYFLNIDFTKPDLASQISISKEENYKKALFYYDKERKTLDSLLNIDQISMEIFKFHKMRNFYQESSLNFSNKLLSIEDANKIILDNNYNNALFQKNLRDKLVNVYVNKFIEPNTSKIKTSNSFFYNNKETFDLIQNSTVLNSDDKKQTLKNQLQSIAENFSKADLNVYLDKYLTKYSDSEVKDYFYKNYINNLGSIDGNIVSIDKKQASINNLIKANKGKLIYIDFWASWCAPCRETMPFSLKLKSKFQNKPILFLYLSIDKNLSAWENANSSEGLADYKHSYLISQNSLINGKLSDLDIKSIPRYILIDKNGEIVSQNAPNPSSSEIEILFNKYL